MVQPDTPEPHNDPKPIGNPSPGPQTPEGNPPGAHPPDAIPEDDLEEVEEQPS